MISVWKLRSAKEVEQLTKRLRDACEEQGVEAVITNDHTQSALISEGRAKSIKAYYVSTTGYPYDLWMRYLQGEITSAELCRLTATKQTELYSAREEYRRNNV